MRTTRLGPFDHISRLTLGGAGLGEVWGATDREEALATITEALAAGINLIDAAPRYRNCEAVIGEAFAGRLPDGVRITTKCGLGAPERGTVASLLEASLDASLSAMRLDRVDVFFLHNFLADSEAAFRFDDALREQHVTPWTQYVEEVVPAFEDLKARGRIGAWGITGVGVPSTILKALRHEVRPDVVQAISNLMDSPGGMRAYLEAPRPRDIIREAAANGVGVMGIRAVQAGALTSAIDRPLKDTHPEMRDYRAAASFRALCAEIGEEPASVAHRYALSMPGVDTVVLGVKNRQELAQCVTAEAQNPIDSTLLARIDALGLANG
ncbi:MAG: aldo/keto reductase [Caulobacter sp.]|nr:aldo/keto reductase [Caulobacter sp.]